MLFLRVQFVLQLMEVVLVVRRRWAAHHEVSEVGHLGGEPLHLGTELKVLRLQVQPVGPVVARAVGPALAIVASR